MNEIRWKRGVPTEEECRECVLVYGSTGEAPRCIASYVPGSTESNNWSNHDWYAAVRILPPEPEKPAEDPEEWVTQDRVPARPGIDQRRWVRRDTKTVIPELSYWNGCYETKVWFRDKAVHGFEHPNEPGLFLEIRCRRKDLPPLPTIREFRTTETEGPQPGSWWVYGIERRYVVGHTTKGNVVLQKQDGSIHLADGTYMSKTWTHLKDCTGWDWQPPKKTKTQRKWVAEEWLDEGCVPWGPLSRVFTRTDDVREVPL